MFLRIKTRLALNVSAQWHFRLMRRMPLGHVAVHQAGFRICDQLLNRDHFKELSVTLGISQAALFLRSSGLSHVYFGN